MKRLFTAFLMLCLLCSSTVVFASDADVKILVNGVSLTLVDNDKVVKPIEEDGTVYVPLAAFLDALDISYTESDSTYTITFGDIQQATPEPTTAPTPTPKPKTPYEELKSGSNEKMILDKFLGYVNKFNDPGSVSITEVRKGKDEWSGGYFLKISAANKLGGKVQKWYYLGSELMSFGAAISNYSDEVSCDITAMNKALKFKLEEMGY